MSFTFDPSSTFDAIVRGGIVGFVGFFRVEDLIS